MPKTHTTPTGASTEFDARMSVYDRQEGVRRVYIELDPEFGNANFPQMPEYLEPYPLKSNGGCIGLRFTSQRSAATVKLQRKDDRNRWVIEFHGPVDGKWKDLFDTLGRAVYGVSPTRARLFHKTSVLRVVTPKAADRVPVKTRGDTGGDDEQQTLPGLED